MLPEEQLQVFDEGTEVPLGDVHLAQDVRELHCSGTRRDGFTGGRALSNSGVFMQLSSNRVLGEEFILKGPGEMEGDRHRDRQTERQADGDRQADRDRQTGRQRQRD